MERRSSHNAIAIAERPTTTSGACLAEPNPPQASTLPIVTCSEKRKEAGFTRAPSPAASSATSSIGVDDSQDEEEEDEDEVKSSSRSTGPLDGMAQSLESSLPLKRGLSSFFGGKSRSFTCLKKLKSSSSAEELAKPESPYQYAYNKRRRMERRPEKASSLWSGVGVMVVGTNKLNMPRSISLAYVQRASSGPFRSPAACST